jgi:hypothetical protein
MEIREDNYKLNVSIFMEICEDDYKLNVSRFYGDT